MPPADQKKTSKSLVSKGFIKHASPVSRAHLAIVVIIFAAVGGYILFKSFAQGPLVSTIEAEQMVLPSGSSVVSDTNASAGKAVKMTASGMLNGSVNFPSSVTSLNINARGDQCAGAPTMTVALDGNNVLVNTAVSATSWSSFSYTPVNAYNSGTHNLSISFTNAAAKTKGSAKNKCTRNLYVDVTNFYGPAPAPTPLPTVTLGASPSSLTAGQSSTLTWNSSNATSCSASGAWSGVQPISGSVSTGAMNQNSTYTLTCTGSGGSSTSSVTVAVSASQTLTANFTSSATTGQAPLTVYFTDTSSGGPTSWLWNFGDGITSTLQNPSHTYNNAGTFTVTLTASNNAGSNTKTAEAYIIVSAAGTPVVVDQMVTPEGTTIQIYSDAVGGWTAQKIYDILKPNAYQLSLIGPTLTIKVSAQWSTTTTTSVTNISGSYSNYKAISYLTANGNSSFSSEPDAILTHEYGHAWSLYHLYITQQGDYTGYLTARGLLGNTQLDSSYMWNKKEILAEDYRLLFGTTLAQNEMTQMNYLIPDARTVTGLKNYLANNWTTKP
jgi:PKD repeat protein